jgi:nucleoside-diphosphate-sugar epimerase
MDEQATQSQGVHVVVGAGPVGRGTALVLASQGHAVRLVSRRGTGPVAEGISLVSGDASKAADVERFTVGATAVYSCVNPPYTSWETDWPPIHEALLGAAQRTGAVLVLCDNLYGLGDTAGRVMREDDALVATGKKGRVRARMAEELLEAHAAGRVRAVVVRSSDYLGPEVTDALMGERVLPKVLAGKAVSVLGSLDEPHTWTYVPDVARLMALGGTDERAWGRAWHTPSAPAMTQRELVQALATEAGTTVKVRALPHWVLKAAGLVVPLMRELEETEYQFAAPFVMGDEAARSELGISHTPLAEQLRATVAWWRASATKAA